MHPWQVPQSSLTTDSTALKMTLTIIVVVIGFIAFRFTKFGTYLKAIGAGEKRQCFRVSAPTA